MMNKKKTRATGRIKYALFVPLAAALLVASNISCISSEKKDGQAETTVPVEQKEAPVTAPAQANDTEQVFQITEQMPEFPGGMAECLKFIGEHVNYPQKAQENGIQGRVTVQFTVEKDGSITNAKVLRGVDPELDKEALRVISSMPKWTPGKQRGKAVRCSFSVPVRFQLR